MQTRKLIKDSISKTTTWQQMSEMKRKRCLDSLISENSTLKRGRGGSLSMHNSIMEGLKRISTKSTPTGKNRNGIAARSTTSPIYNSTAADTKDYQMRDEPGRTYNGDWLKPKDNQMPPQAFLK